jgi:hypothetical protein
MRRRPIKNLPPINSARMEERNDHLNTLLDDP